MRAARVSALIAVLCLSGLAWMSTEARAQPAHPVEPPAPSVGGSTGGLGVQIDVLGLVRALGQGRQSAALVTDWPDADAALLAYSLPPERVRQPVVDGDPVCEPGELLVLWPSAEAAEQGLRELSERDQLRPTAGANLPTLGGVIARYQLPDNEAALALRGRLRARHPDWAVDLNARSAAAAGPRLYALQQLGETPAARDPAAPTTLARGIRVGVIDGPTDVQAELQTGGFVANSLLWPGELAAPPQHGNTVARLLAARPRRDGFVGVAPGAALHWATVTRLVQGLERSNTLAQVLALDWLLGQSVHLVNISMGGASDHVLAVAFRRATARPVVFLAAVGNSGPSAEPVYPAAYPGVLAVTATDALLQVYAWANQGPQVALAAPGVDLWLPTAGEGAGGTVASGQYVSGTSFATALATGMLANWGEARLRQAVTERLAPICKAARDLGAAGKDPVFGCGLVR